MGKFAINEELLQQVETLQLIVKDNIAGMFGGNHQSKTFGSSCEFADYRDYMPGDDISKIDWNAYARFDKLFLKLYLDERQLHTRIYIDASRSMDYGKGQKAIRALQIAATMAYLSICEMDKVSIYYIKDNKVYDLITNMVGKETYYTQINKLNDIDFDGEIKISEAILPSTVGYGDGMSIIISDFLTDYDFAEAIDYLASKKRNVFCIQLLESEELKPKTRGKIHLFDSENINVSYRKNVNKDIINAYKEALNYLTERVRTQCLTRNGYYLLANVDLSVKEIFLRKMMQEGVLK
ncbi:MAG: DUF58 domain-containing protein [Acholeplasmatales bacterium]|nr:DUF58 domain-containing protein [Acholeplasmatales bacterium]